MTRSEFEAGWLAGRTRVLATGDDGLMETGTISRWAGDEDLSPVTVTGQGSDDEYMVTFEADDAHCGPQDTGERECSVSQLRWVD